VASIERRIEALEAQFVPPEDEGEQLREAIVVSILNEFSSLKADRPGGRGFRLPVHDGTALGLRRPSCDRA
jgi:hypothetical protein